MKKVVMFAGLQHEIPPTKGAAVQTWIYEVSKRLIMHQVHVISIAHDFMPNKEYKHGVYFHRIVIGKLYKRIFQKILGWDIWSYNKRVFKIIKQIHPDIVHIHNEYNSKEIINWIRKFDHKIIIILHMHNENNKFQKNTFPKINIFLGCSNHIINYYKDKINTDLFQTIYNGVDITKFSETRNHKNEIKQLKQIDQNKKNIFYFGRISEEKGVDKIVQIATLFKENKDFKFYCIGEISISGGRRVFYSDLVKIIKNKNLLNIVFLDYIAPDKIHLAYQMADLVIIPSKVEESFCMVAIEAMASYVPVLSVYKGGLKEYLKDNVNSIIIEDYENFSEKAYEKIISLFQNQIHYNDLTQNAFNTVKNRFDWQKIAIEVENVYL